MSWFDSNKTIFILECSTTIKWSKIVVAYYDMISTHLAAMGIGLCQFASNCIWQMLMKIRSWVLITPVVFWSVSHCWQVLSSMWHLGQECNVRQPKSEVLMNSFSSSLQLKDEVKLLIFSLNQNVFFRTNWRRYTACVSKCHHKQNLCWKWINTNYLDFQSLQTTTDFMLRRCQQQQKKYSDCLNDQRTPKKSTKC